MIRGMRDGGGNPTCWNRAIGMTGARPFHARRTTTVGCSGGGGFKIGRACSAGEVPLTFHYGVKKLTWRCSRGILRAESGCLEASVTTIGRLLTRLSCRRWRRFDGRIARHEMSMAASRRVVVVNACRDRCEIDYTRVSGSPRDAISRRVLRRGRLVNGNRPCLGRSLSPVHQSRPAQFSDEFPNEDIDLIMPWPTELLDRPPPATPDARPERRWERRGSPLALPIVSRPRAG